MRKFKFIVLLVLCILVTGCGDAKERDLRPSVVLEDLKNNLITTWRYEEGENISYRDADYQGKYKEIVVRNEDLNMRITMYYFETSESAFNAAKENRKERPEFWEYTWNGYNGYTYSGDEEKMYYQILLGTNVELNRTIALAGQVDYIDKDKGNIVDAFNSEAFQRFMNTMEFREG